ncbi:MarR family winged helix-turn-helix transcriptional regulator [Kineococcus gynurae]|uniref:MarR family winged helix-turn-helix transcriptional regulator n=1 Tax=Kineococcus gynurae TaxID=452979 RepID=A0ABV5LNN4_9ACTN
MTDSVNGPWLPALLEHALRRLRPTLLTLSEDRFPGLRARHYRLLVMLPTGGERLSRLAEVAGLTKQALAQTLDPLLAAGFVEVGPDPADGRARLVRRTSAGTEVVRAVRTAMEQVEADWAAEVGAERWAVVREVLTELSRAKPATSG